LTMAPSAGSTTNPSTLLSPQLARSVRVGVCTSQVNTLLAIVEVPSSSKTSLHAKREGGIGQMIEYPIHITEYSIHADKTRSLCPARKRAWHLREYNACSNTRAAQHRASSPHEKPAAAQSRKSLLSGPWVSAPGYTNLLSRRSSHRGVGLHWGKPGMVMAGG
jgi:hypothetical protein